MIEFKVTGERWREILETLDGMFPGVDISINKSVVDTVEEPEDSFKTTMTAYDKDDPVVKNIVADSPTVVTPVKKPIGRPPAVAKPSGVLEKYKLPFGPLDSANQPWDKNIHARTKTKTEDGRWRLKRKTPGFATSADSQPLPVVTAPGIPSAVSSSPAVVTPAIPDFTAPPADAIDTQQKMIAYLTKIKESKGIDYGVISQYFTTQGIVNILHVPLEKLPEVAANLKIKFGVDY